MSKKRLLARALARTGTNALSGCPDPPEPVEQGLVLCRQGHYREALRVWEKSAAPPAARAEAFFRLGLEQQAAGQTRAALTSWQKAVQLRPDRAAYHFHRGLAAHLLNDLTQAAASYRQALGLNPDRDRMLFHLGLVMVMQAQDQGEVDAWLEGEGRNLSPARRRFLRAAASRIAGQEPASPEPGDVDPAGTRLLYALQAGPRVASARIDEALALEPENPAAWRMRSLVLAALGDPGTGAALQKALDLGACREELVPRVTELKKSFLNQLVERGDLAQAVDFLAREGKTTLAPVDPRGEKAALLLTLHGNALARRQEWAQAAECWQKALGLGRRDPHLWHNLALAAELLGQAGNAASYWRRTIDAWTRALREGRDEARLGPSLACAYRHLAELEAEQGHYERYITTLELAIKYAPADIQMRLDLARAFAAGHEGAKCLTVLEEVLPLAPDNPDVISGLALGYLKKGEWQKAGSLLEHGMAVAPEDPQVRKCMTDYYLRRAEAEARDYKSTLPWMEKALAVAPERAPVLIQMAVFAHVNKRWRDWSKHLDEALSLSPDHPGLYFQVAELFFGYDRPEMGKKHLKLALAGAPHDPDAYMEAARLYMAGGLPGDAGKCLKLALKLAPAIGTYQKAAGWCIEYEEWELALPILTGARKAFPDVPEILIDLTGVLVSMERYQEAYRTLLESEEVFRKGGFDPESSPSFRAMKRILEEELFD